MHKSRKAIDEQQKAITGKRPLITEFMGDGFTLNKAHKQYLENLELWNYIQALDAYCDELETSDSGLNIPDVTHLMA